PELKKGMAPLQKYSISHGMMLNLEVCFMMLQMITGSILIIIFIYQIIQGLTYLMPRNSLKISLKLINSSLKNKTFTLPNQKLKKKINPCLRTSMNLTMIPNSTSWKFYIIFLSGNRNNLHKKRAGEIFTSSFIHSTPCSHQIFRIIV